MLAGLAACSSLPSSSTRAMQDFQTRLQADTRAAQLAIQERDAADRRAAGIVGPEEQRTADGVQVILTTGHVAGVAAVGISADGRYVISSDATQVKVWEVASHSEVRSFTVNSTPSLQSTFRVTSGGCRLLLGRQSVVGTATLRDCVTGNEIASASVISDDGSISVSDATTQLRQGLAVMGPNNAGLTITELATGRQSVLPAAAGSSALAISANGQTLLTNVFGVNSNGWRSSVSGLVDIAGGVASIVVPGAGSVAALIGGSATDAVVGTSPQELTMDIEAWNVPAHRKLLSVRTSRLSNLAALSADGRRLFVENKDRSIEAYDLASGQKQRIAPPDATLASPVFIHDKLVLSANGGALARQCEDDSVEIFDTLSGQKLRVFSTDSNSEAPSPLSKLGNVSAIVPVFSPDGKLIAVGSAAQRIHVWELATGRSVLQTQASSIAFSPDGRTAILGRSDEGAPILHDLTTSKEEAFGVHLDSVVEVAVSADGRLAIATSVPPGGARLWDLATGELAGNLRTCPGGSIVLSARPSPIAALVAAQCSDGSVALWDQASAQWKQQLSAATPDAPSVRAFKASVPVGTHWYGAGDDVHFSADGRLLAVAADEQVTIWNLEAHTTIARITTQGMPVPAAMDPVAALRQAAATTNAPGDTEALKATSQSESELNQALVNAQQSGYAKIREQLSDPQYLEMLGTAVRQITGLAIDGSGHRIALVRAGEVSLWDFQTGQLLRTLKVPEAYATGRVRGGLNFAPDGRTLYGPGGISWDLSSGEAITASTQPAATNPADRIAMARMYMARMSAGMSACCDTTSALSPDGKLLARGVGQVVRLTDPASGQEMGDLLGHTGQVTSLAFDSDGKALVSGSDDGSVRVWSVATRKEVVSLYALGGMDYVAVTPDQFYRASKARLSGISFRVKDQLYPFEQFDLRFNRPDLVAEGLGRATPEEIQEYRKAREHRLRKMGFTEAMLTGTFHLPDARVVGSEPPARVAASSLPLRVRAEDSQYPLDRINVFVNDVPISGTSGFPVADRQSRSDEQQVVVPLVPGANKIQVSALNQQGVESLKQTFYTLNSATPPPGDIYIVAIGVSQYKNPRYNLKFAAKDADDLMNLYSGARSGAAHGQVHLLDLTNERATRAEIRQARAWLAQARPNDLAIVFAAGHGVTDAHDDYYFGTYDIDAANPEVNGLGYEEFENLLDGIPPLKKMLLLDTCFSGEIDREETSVVEGAATDGNGTVKMRSFRAARGVSLVGDATGSASASASASTSIAAGTRHFENLFADLRRGTGAVVISSASGNEYALEGERWNNGVFTYAVLSGLKEGRADANKDGVVTVGELQAYVIDEVRKLTAGGQNPTVRQENLDFDFEIY